MFRYVRGGVEWAYTYHIYAFVDVIPLGFACGKANQLLQGCHSQLLVLFIKSEHDCRLQGTYFT